MSTLEEELKAMEAQLAEMEKPEEVVAEEAVAEEPAQEPEEKPSEPVVEEQKPVEEEDVKGAARLRIEAKKERERADKLAAELAAEREAKKKDAPAEEKQEAFESEIIQVIQEKKRADATKEFLAYEEDVRSKNPEYDAVAQEYASAMMAAVRMENPQLKGAMLQEAAMSRIINRAAQYAAKGYENPVEALFNEAKELGFNGASYKKLDQGVEAKPESKPKPDMKKVAENRQKSPGMAAAGGGDAQGQLTKKYAVENFTLADFEKLSSAEAERLMYGA